MLVRVGSNKNIYITVYVFILLILVVTVILHSCTLFLKVLEYFNLVVSMCLQQFKCVRASLAIACASNQGPLALFATLSSQQFLLHATTKISRKAALVAASNSASHAYLYLISISLILK